MQTTTAIPAASPWVMRFLPGIAPGGAVLDVACGGGRHLRAARAAGHPVTGVDRTLDGVSDLAGAEDVELIAADLETSAPFPVRGRTFAGVIVTNYLWRPILPDIAAAVASDGLLIYETFALGHERFGRPANPDFLLRTNELLEAARLALTVIAYEHGLIAGSGSGDDGDGRIVQRIVACGPRHAWAAHGHALG